MQIVRSCPGCGSKKIRGSVLVEDSQYIQTISCDDCDYTNHREIGSAEEEVINDETDYDQDA